MHFEHISGFFFLSIFYKVDACNPTFALFCNFSGQRFYNYLNLQDKLQCLVCIGKTSQLLFCFEFVKTNPSFVVIEVKNLFCHSGELSSCKLEENPHLLYDAVQKHCMAII